MKEWVGLFEKGGPIMWPLLVTSIAALTVVIERIVFIVRERSLREPEVVEKILSAVEDGDRESAIQAGQTSRDFVARTLVYGLSHSETSFSNALLRAASLELKRFNQGLVVLDTIITLSPLLGLLGTVTGMIHAFSLLGGAELDAPAAITGGIAEALIATAFGLAIAILCLIPYNYLNGRLEEARHEIEDAASNLEILLAHAAPGA
ncbi:MAG: MotA/TolQ/ExbB proton channel family protein [Candidatus Omnitrophica bacterium]|nr:MotA/TolQ/ExbB proton channel family protein [Candidatus Omnitrophota bacterium]